MTQGGWVQGPYGWQWQPKAKKRMSTLAALTFAGAIVAVVAWGAIFISFLNVNSSFTAKGSMTLGQGCGEYRGGYSDIGLGTQVTVKVNGETVALGSLGGGSFVGDIRDGICTFPITIPGVPGGHDFYLVEVSHRGGITYTEDEMRAGVYVTLG